MKHLTTFIASLVFASTFVSAHEGNEHVRGVVTQISPKAITVQTTAKATKTLTLTDKTTFQLGGKAAHLTDLKVGDRVVVDVPEKTSEALLIQIGTAAAPAQSGKSAQKLSITLVTVPKAAKLGDNTFDVTVKDEAGRPVADADVSVLLTMPAMPAMKMPAMRTDVKLDSAGAGEYTGTGRLMSAGNWNVTVSVKKDGTEIGQKKSILAAAR